jgi:hypothetical protein
VGVQIDESGCENQTSRIDPSASRAQLAGQWGRRDGDDLRSHQAHVADCVEPTFGIDHAGSDEDHVELFGGSSGRCLRAGR